MPIFNPLLPGKEKRRKGRGQKGTEEREKGWEET